MTPAPITYPWYAIATGEEIHQGEIFESCPVFSPRVTDLNDPNTRSTFDWFERDVVVLTQSCDLVRRGPKRKAKVKDVLVCVLWSRSEITSGHLGTPKGLEEARRGNLPAFHMLAECTLQEFNREIRLADFHFLWSLPLDYLSERAVRAQRLRLMPPYREQLSQSFARYFIRVGLPLDIPEFAEAALLLH